MVKSVWAIIITEKAAKGENENCPSSIAKKEEKDVIEAIQNGATSYIVKPITQEQLKKHVDKTIEWLKENSSLLTEYNQKKQLKLQLKKLFIMRPFFVQLEINPNLFLKDPQKTNLGKIQRGFKWRQPYGELG